VLLGKQEGHGRGGLTPKMPEHHWRSCVIGAPASHAEQLGFLQARNLYTVPPQLHKRRGRTISLAHTQ